jgi:N-methylhydantoinase B
MNAIDPITLEVVCEGLIAIVREMRATVIRASYSPVIWELDDFSCALFDATAQMIAQSEDHPGHVLPMPWSVRCAMEDFAGDVRPGDIILLNDPYRGGTHLNDVTMLYPVFEEGELFIFPAVRAHWADVGGMTPGSYSGLSTSIYQEGVRIPPIKIYEEGRLNQAAMALLLSNMRLPEDRLGDFNAAQGACRVAEGRIRKLLSRYGRKTVLDCIALHLDRSERRLRARIAALPDGEYVHEDYLEFYEDGRLDPVLMRLALTVKGDEIIADFTGSSPQVPGVVNSSLATTGAGVFVAIKSTLDPAGPINHGVFRPIRLVAPEASIVDVRPDAPAGAHGEVRKRAVSVTLAALAQVVPDLVSGDLCGTSFPNAIGGYDPLRRRHYVYYEAPAGGNGGFREDDGSSAHGNIDFGNIRTIQTAEALENGMPFLVERCELRMDSGGEGRMRGGLGMRRELRLLAGEGRYSALADRAQIPPFGVGGAGPAAPVKVSVIRQGAEIEFTTPGKVTGYPLVSQDVVIMQSAGGGGYGDPLARDPERVRDDVAAGRVSPARARDGYGVVFTAVGEVDQDATRARRAGLAAARVRLPVRADEREAYTGVRGKHRVLRLGPALASRLGVARGDLVELHGRHAAPVRAWVIIDAGERGAEVPLDALGRRMLGVDPGDVVELRRLAMPPFPGGVTGRSSTETTMTYPGIRPGLRGEQRAIVTESMVTRHAGGTAGIMTTPSMILLMEETAQEVTRPFLPTDHTTVGFEILVRHLASAPLGAEVTLAAELLAMDGRKLLFAVSAHHEGRRIGEGTLRRTIVPLGTIPGTGRERPDVRAERPPGT